MKMYMGGFDFFSWRNSLKEHIMKFEKIFRVGNKLYTSNHKFLARLVQGFTRFRYNCDIPVQTEIAPDTYFCHNAFGVVINPRAKIGGGVLLFSIV